MWTRIFIIFLSGVSEFSFFYFAVSLVFSWGKNSSIVLGPIEGELAKKQVPIDLGRTPKALIPLISKPLYVHGGLRLAKENESKYSATFSSAGVNKIQVSITSGSPKIIY